MSYFNSYEFSWSDYFLVRFQLSQPQFCSVVGSLFVLNLKLYYVTTTHPVYYTICFLAATLNGYMM